MPEGWIHEQQRIEDIYRYLKEQQWHGNEEEGQGCTWLELFAHYEISGHAWAQTEEGQTYRLSEARRKGCKDVKRWDIHQQRRRNGQLKRVAQKFEHIKSLRTELASFKRLVRYITRTTDDPYTWVYCSHDTRNTRITGLGITGHQPYSATHSAPRRDREIAASGAS